jgi:hypothetical protein
LTGANLDGKYCTALETEQVLRNCHSLRRGSFATSSSEYLPRGAKLLYPFGPVFKTAGGNAAWIRDRREARLTFSP